MRRILSQFKNIFALKYFIVGVFIAFLIHSSGSCRKDDPEPDGPAIEQVDVGKIDQGAKSVETAFTSGDAASIKNILTDDAKELYGNDLPKIDKNSLIKLGEALKSRKIKVYTDMYAEYEYAKDGITYSIAMARKEDGSWKLMRF
jgi:hypothetical protein